jgi:DNA-binding CsgD family transcriptional regulator
VVGQAKRLMPMPTLTVVSEGDSHGQSFVIDSDETVVGRRDNCDVRLVDPYVSRAHALIRRQGGAIWVEDLGSTGGTYVNGVAITGARALRHGDAIRFGTVETRFEDRQAAMERDDATAMIEVPEPAAPERPVLSPRQQEVLQYLEEGLTNPEIAQRLGVTERTVKAHCQEVFDRLGARNRTAAVAAAMRMGLLETE